MSPRLWWWDPPPLRRARTSRPRAFRQKPQQTGSNSNRKCLLHGVAAWKCRSAVTDDESHTFSEDGTLAQPWSKRGSQSLSRVSPALLQSLLGGTERVLAEGAGVRSRERRAAGGGGGPRLDAPEGGRHPPDGDVLIDKTAFRKNPETGEPRRLPADVSGQDLKRARKERQRCPVPT